MKPSVEQLESRATPANVWLDGAGFLHIVAQRTGSTVQVLEPPGQGLLIVHADRQTILLEPDKVNAVVFQAGKGVDSVVFFGLDMPATVIGGSGRDIFSTIPASEVNPPHYSPSNVTVIGV